MLIPILVGCRCHLHGSMGPSATPSAPVAKVERPKETKRAGELPESRHEPAAPGLAAPAGDPVLEPRAVAPRAPAIPEECGRKQSEA
jgi:hypothetical protein